MVNIGESITIVTACRNRLDNLNKVINSWANIKPKKIIIIDFGSDKKITFDKLDLKEKVNIEIIREESDRWILSWAFNLGLEKVNTNYTLKLDCESFLKDNFLIKNKPKRMSFLRGNWRFYEQDKIFFNGSFLSCTELLKEVGYYDERIITYGWEDSELYQRLSDNALETRVIDPDSFDVIPQEDSERTSNQEVSLEKLLSDEISIPIDNFLINRNQKYTNLIEKWSKEKYLKRLEIRTDNSLKNNPKLLLATFQTFFQFFKSNKSMETRLMKDKFIIRRFNFILKNHYIDYKNLFPNFPKLRKYLRQLKNNPLNDRSTTETLYSSFINLYKMNDMNSLSNILKKDSSNIQIAETHNDSKLIVVPQMGLCNRIRSIAAAYCIAKNSNRKLIICWDKDYHLNCEMHDLFSIAEDQIEVQDSKLLSAMHDFRIYDYSEFIPNNHKFKNVDVNTPLPILIKSSSSIFSEYTSFDEEDLFIKSLKINANVQKIIKKNKIAKNTVGVHIRYSGKGWENQLSESNCNWSDEDHITLVKSRNQSKPECFIRKMELLLEKDNNLKFYISSPNNLAVEFFKEKLGKCVYGINIPKIGDEREKTQLEFAMADLVNLSKCKLLLGSPFSSFTEVAYRLNNFKDKKLEIAGEDF